MQKKISCLGNIARLPNIIEWYYWQHYIVYSKLLLLRMVFTFVKGKYMFNKYKSQDLSLLVLKSPTCRPLKSRGTYNKELTVSYIIIIHYFVILYWGVGAPQCMNQITIKTPNPKRRLHWCLIEFIDWRYSQSCWCFRPLLWTSAFLTFSLVHLSSFPRVNKYGGMYLYSV